MTIICTYVASSVVLQTNHLDRHLFEPCLPPSCPPSMAAWHASSLHCIARLLHIAPYLSTLLCALVHCSFHQSRSTFLQSLGTSQVVCHLPPTPICQSPKLRSRLRSRRKKCGFDETQFLKSIPNSLTLTHIICIFVAFLTQTSFVPRSEPERYSEV